jgi:hypothetical protein
VIAKIVPARTNGDFVRLGRYITDGKTAEHSSAAERLGRYVLDSRHGGEKVAWSRVSNCGTDHVPLAMLQIRNTQACNSRAANKTLHLVISFPEGERPNERQLHQIEDRMVASLGMEAHQRLSALHVNTRHAHLHVAINRVHPETYRCADPSFGQRRLMRACHELEIEFGLTRISHGLGRDDTSREPIKGRAATMEAQSGLGSFARWVRDTARDDLLAAKDKGWPALHQVAAEHGLHLQPRGAGLTFADATRPHRAVKASTVDRALSMGALVKACGPYQPAPERLPPAQSRYQPQPLHQHAKARPLYERYRQERDAALDARAQRIATWREEQRAYRKELTTWYREEKHKLTHGWLESLSLDKAQRRRELAQQRAKLWERSCKAEKGGVAKIREQHPLPVWKDWLERQAQARDRDAMRVLHSRSDHTALALEREFPQPSRPSTPATRHTDQSLGAPPYLPWSPELGGEFTYLGLRDPGSGPALVWQQGGKFYVQAATRKAQEAARDVEPGDAVMFYQGRPIVTRGNERDTGRGR